MGALSRRRAVPRPLPLVLCSILWSGEAFVSSRRRYLQRRTSSNPNNDVRLQFTVSSTATSRPAPWQSVKDPFPGGNSPRIVLYSASSMADSRRRGRRRLKSEQLLPLASSKTTYDSNNKSPGLMATLFQFSVVVAAYLLHLLVLSQRQVVFPVQLFPNDRGHFTGLGWDSIAGMVSLCVYGIQQSISKLRNKQLYQQQRSVRPWNLPRDNLRFRLTTSLTCVLLVQAYFLTGRMSIFWEDMLYELSARDFAITIPLFRALTVLLGHLSWVIVGSSLLRWLPRPPPFFQKREHVSVSVNNSRAPSEPTTGNNAANDKGNVIEEVIEEYIDDGDDDLDDSPPDSKIYKKLFRTDISTLYSQTGIPKKHPSQVPDIPPKQTKGHKPRKKQIRRVKSVSPSNSLIPQSPQQQQSEPQTPLTSMYYWFSNNSSSNWMWWTIGGYVSSAMAFLSSYYYDLLTCCHSLLRTTVC